MKMTLKDLAQAVGGNVIGDESAEVSGVASLAQASPYDLIFVEEEKNLAAALESRAAAAIAGEFTRNRPLGKTVIIATQPKLAFARAAKILCAGSSPSAGVHSTAIVHPTAKIDAQVSIGERVVIGEEVEIGTSTSIGAGCVIGDGARIGRNCEIYPNVTIYSGSVLGDRVVIHAGAVLGSDGFGYVRDVQTGRYEKFPQKGRLEIGDDVEIGANTTIDRGALEVTKIGRGTKIDNLVQIAHNVQIGEDVVIASQTGISGSAVIENGAVIAGQVGIADHVRIEEGVILGAQCGVPTKKVVRGKGIVFWGTPARPIKAYLKELAVLAKLAKKE